MNELTHGSITDAVVDGLAPGRDRVLWDRALTGFGVRVYPSGARVYVVQTRGPKGTRRTTVGRHGVIGAGEARRRASLIIARVKAGEDLAERPAPKPQGPTLAALARRYLREHVAVRCKPSTAAQYRLAIERHIVPALGTLPVSAIARRDVADLQHTLRDRPAMANLVVATLKRMIDQAQAWGVAAEGVNPCRAAQKYRVGRRERFLTDAEFRRLARLPQLGGREDANPLIFLDRNIKGRHYRAPRGGGGSSAVRRRSAARAVAAGSCRAGAAVARALCSAGCVAAGRGAGRRWLEDAHRPSGWWRRPR